MSELFCSGIPLTDTPYQSDFHYTAAIPTSEVLARAVAHFDSALTYAGDSAAVVTLARVGKGRALLDAGDFAGAAAAVNGVATDAVYRLQYDATLFQNQIYYSGLVFPYMVTNREGNNGLVWTTGTPDPRVPIDPSSRAQTKYGAGTSLIAANGVEARLIEAEALLHANDYAGWIAILQALAAPPGTPGSGGLSGVPVPVDPGAVSGSDSARVSLQFSERAKWLFLTGHRQGDLRRLLRQYGRPAITTYPTGPYTPAQIQYVIYGSDIVVSPPRSEQQQNPLYKGCLNRAA